MDLAYDGSTFYGFAAQRGRETVSGVLQETLAAVLGLDVPPVITVAGRTDTGVHALAQVIHVDLPVTVKVRRFEGERLRSSLNKQLRGRIQVLAIVEVPMTFHARFSASWREYRYLVVESDEPGLGFTNAVAWSVTGPLHLDAMNEAASHLLGTHDFRAFCRRPAKSEAGAPLRRRVMAARWERTTDTLGLTQPPTSVVKLTIRAQSFCHNMVRCSVSTMVAVGRGQLAPSVIAERLVSGDRHQLPPAAPASGLALVAVGYDVDGLASSVGSSP